MLADRVKELAEEMEQRTKNIIGFDIRNNDKTKNFNNFIAGENNRAVKEAAKAFSKGFDGVLYIYGPKGSGKSHLVNAIVNAKSNDIENENIEITTAEMFLNRSIDALIKQETRELWNDYHQKQLIVFEEFDEVEKRDVMVDELLKLLHSLDKCGKTLILTGTKPLAEHFASSLSVVSFDFPYTVLKLELAEREARLEILKNAADEIQSGSMYANLKNFYRMEEEIDPNCSIVIGLEIILLIEENVTGSVDEMLKALDRVVKFSALLDKNVDEDFVREVLKEYFQ